MPDYVTRSKLSTHASFARHFLKPLPSSCCFLEGILFIFAASGIFRRLNMQFILSKVGLVVKSASLMSPCVRAIATRYTKNISSR